MREKRRGKKKREEGMVIEFWFNLWWVSQPSLGVAKVDLFRGVVCKNKEFDGSHAKRHTEDTWRQERPPNPNLAWNNPNQNSQKGVKKFQFFYNYEFMTQ